VGVGVKTCSRTANSGRSAAEIQPSPLASSSSEQTSLPKMARTALRTIEPSQAASAGLGPRAQIHAAASTTTTRPPPLRLQTTCASTASHRAPRAVGQEENRGKSAPVDFRSRGVRFRASTRASS
jgi:hypothetical protein